ncbi:MAG: RNA methyltransferase [Bacteroidota bacterium]|nr:RNA methyltransferase [Bacteroidota bacterium]
MPYPLPTSDDVSHAQACAEVLRPLVTEARLAKLQRVAAQRSRHISVVLENVYQSRNASAVMRSADGLGLLDVHLIENENAWSRNKGVAKGASQWLNLHRYLGTDDPRLACVNAIKAQGIKLVVTSPHAEGHTPENLPLDEPVALVMGTEFSGASDFMMEHADAYVEIPMQGFAESFNISVAAAIVMHRLRTRLEHSSADWRLHPDELSVLNAEWIFKSVRNARGILARHGLTPPPNLVPDHD